MIVFGFAQPKDKTLCLPTDEMVVKYLPERRLDELGYKEQMDTFICAIGHLLGSLMEDVKSLPGMTESKVEAIVEGLFSCLRNDVEVLNPRRRTVFHCDGQQFQSVEPLIRLLEAMDYGALGKDAPNVDVVIEPFEDFFPSISDELKLASPEESLAPSIATGLRDINMGKTPPPETKTPATSVHGSALSERFLSATRSAVSAPRGLFQTAASWAAGNMGAH